MGYLIFSCIAEDRVEYRALAHPNVAISNELLRRKLFHDIAKASKRRKPEGHRVVPCGVAKAVLTNTQGIDFISEREAEEHMSNNPITGE